MSMRSASARLEFGRGRSWCRSHPAFRLRHPAPRGREGAGGAAELADKNPDILKALVRAHIRAAEFIEQPKSSRGRSMLAQPERIGVDAASFSAHLRWAA